MSVLPIETKHRKKRTRITLWHLITGRRPDSMPLGQWRRVRVPAWLSWLGAMFIWAWGGVGVALLLHWGGYVSLDWVPSGYAMSLLSFAAVADIMLFWWIPLWRERRFRDFVVAHNYEVCSSCAYWLKGLPAVHTCPECGARYSIDDLCASWKSWFEAETSQIEN
jgi:hypothetical protein